MTNSTNADCPIDNFADPNWDQYTTIREKGEILAGQGTWTYQTELNKNEFEEGENEQMSVKTFFYEKGDMQYLKGFFVEGSGGDYIILGGIYLGVMDEESGEIRLPEDVVAGADPELFLTEKHVYSVTQEQVKENQRFTVLEGVEAATTAYTLEVEISYSDGVNTRSQVVDLIKDSKEVIENKLYDGIFGTKCVYPEGITPMYTKDFESNMLWPHYVMPHFQSIEPWCGHAFFDEFENYSHWEWVWHKDHWQNPGQTIDIIQDADQVNALCFAFYENLYEIRVRANVQGSSDLTFADGQWYHFVIDWKAEGGQEWDFKCLDIKSAFNEHSAMNPADHSADASGLTGLGIYRSVLDITCFCHVYELLIIISS